MKIYRLKIKNAELSELPALYVAEKRTVDAVVNSINSFLKEGKSVEWEAEEIDVLSHEEAFSECLEGFTTVFNG